MAGIKDVDLYPHIMAQPPYNQTMSSSQVRLRGAG